jgi:NAD(P)-dependent dehydrogenase (short-subunit alcohol dehydrogenase family)
VTTRFPRDAASRYSREPDFGDWGGRLEIVGLDLRHTPSLEAFCKEMLATRSRLDFVINNACQTVKRPPAFYAHMLEREKVALQELTDDAQRLIPAFTGDIASQDVLFPAGRLDADLQQDLRARSWRLLLADVSTVELLEVQLVNAIAPFILNARLKSLMTRTPERDKHIVNVSAMEGQFYRRFKTTRHPHTNMAKAALNMMTRTSATDYHGDGIHMNSVDTGWITDETLWTSPHGRKSSSLQPARQRGWCGPCRRSDHHRVNRGIHAWSQFLKDCQYVG